MTLKERLLEWLIRPEGFYIRRYLKFLRKEERYTLDSPSRLKAYWYKARKNRLGSRLGFIISAGCFGEGLRIDHYGSIIVNPKARIGKTCLIHGNCCIGNKGGESQDSPVIGDNVNIGQNAQILGGIRIADNVTIAAGAVVVRDVLEVGATVAGVPAKVL